MHIALGAKNYVWQMQKKEEARKVEQKSHKNAILYGLSTYPVEEEGQLKNWLW